MKKKNNKKVIDKQFHSEQIHQDIANSFFEDIEEMLPADFDVENYVSYYDLESILCNTEDYDNKNINPTILSKMIFNLLPEHFQNENSEGSLSSWCDQLADWHQSTVDAFISDEEARKEEEKLATRKANFKKSLSPEQLEEMAELYGELKE